MGDAKRRKLMNGAPGQKIIERPNGAAKPHPGTITVGMVGIGIPSMDFVHADFALALASLTGNYRGPHSLISAKGCYVHKSRDHCVRIAKEKGCSHLLFIDSDMVFPSVVAVLPNGNPVTPLHRLLGWQKDVVGCMYSRRVAPFTNLGTPKQRDLKRVASNSGLIEMDMLPTGFMLIDMRVFDRLRRPYFDFKPLYNEDGSYHDEMGEDVRFCEKVREAGMSLWCDVQLSMMIGHIGQAIYQVQEDTKETARQIGQPQHRDGSGVSQAVSAEGTGVSQMAEVEGAPV